MIKVQSSNIASIGSNNNSLFIEFLDGSVYEYKNASYILKKFLIESSKGKFFHKFIKNKFKTIKIKAKNK